MKLLGRHGPNTAASLSSCDMAVASCDQAFVSSTTTRPGIRQFDDNPPPHDKSRPNVDSPPCSATAFSSIPLPRPASRVPRTAPRPERSAPRPACTDTHERNGICDGICTSGGDIQFTGGNAASALLHITDK